ncbi:MAG: hypothetical protein VXW13_05845, partial [SAR324 cluster bacterium]|nr:hypothetical protein [SAR324 cluster bacterium]
SNQFLRQVVQRKREPADPNNVKKLEITGARLAATSTIQSIKKYGESLEADPANSKVRVEMVSDFLRKGAHEGVLQYRDAFMLSMLEADDLILNTEKLRLAMKAQKIYVGHLLLFLQDDLQVQKQDKESKADFIVLANHIKYLKEVNKILPYHNFDEKESVEMDKKKLLKLNRAQHEEILSPILEGVSALPMASKNKAILMEVLEDTKKSIPLSGYYLSRFYRRTAQINLIATMTGDREQAKTTVENLSKSMKAIMETLPMMKKATRKDLSPTVREFALICLMVYQYLPKLGGTLNSDHFKRMEHAEKLLTRIHDERGVSTLQQQLHNAIEYIKTKPKQAPDRGRKSREEREAAEATPTFFKGDVPEERDFRSNKEEKEAPASIFSRNLPKDKEF